MPPLAGSAPDADIPSVDLDEPLDPKLANRPLEPGSGAPDLNAIMKRVRDERGQPAKRSEGDAAKSDFIAAARRAAQAAAAEADALKRQSTMSGPVKALRIGDLLKARRKPILMAAAAIMLALAGLQLGKAFFSDPAPVASNDIAPIIAPQPVETASVNATSEPKAEAMAQDAPARAVRQAEPSEPTVKDDMLAQPASAPPSGADMPMDAISEPAPAPMESAGPSDATEPTAAASAPAAAEPAASDADSQPMAATPVAPAPAQDTTGAVPPANTATAAAAAKIDIPADAGPQALRDAAAGGDAKALFEVGSRFAESRGVKEDMAAAAKWYEKSAELGFAPARIPHRQFLRKGHRRRARHQEGQDLVPAGGRAGQRQRHAQSGRAVRHGRGRRDRQ